MPLSVYTTMIACLFIYLLTYFLVLWSCKNFSFFVEQMPIIYCITFS